MDDREGTCRLVGVVQEWEKRGGEAGIEPPRGEEEGEEESMM
jgi:hypothetical protein